MLFWLGTVKPCPVHVFLLFCSPCGLNVFRLLCAGGPRAANIWCSVQLQHEGRRSSLLRHSRVQQGEFWTFVICTRVSPCVCVCVLWIACSFFVNFHNSPLDVSPIFMSLISGGSVCLLLSFSDGKLCRVRLRKICSRSRRSRHSYLTRTRHCACFAGDHLRVSRWWSNQVTPVLHGRRRILQKPTNSKHGSTVNRRVQESTAKRIRSAPPLLSNCCISKSLHQRPVRQTT